MPERRSAEGSRSSWRPTLHEHDGPLYVRIVDALRSDIRRGVLLPGDRLPTHRAIARHLDVTLSTVTHAINEATRQHLVDGRVGNGTFVLGANVDAALFAATLTDAVAPATDQRRDLIDLTSNAPAIQTDSRDLQEVFRALARRGSAELGGYPTQHQLRRGETMFADLLRARGVVVPPDGIVLAAGAQQALLATLITVAGPGAKVLAESLTFPGLKAVARALRLQLVPVRIDQEGLVPTELERVCRSSGSTTLVCVPTLHNPTGATMSATRRAAIAEVVARLGISVIEDDVYGALQNEPALASCAPAQTIVVTSLSKTVAAGLRLGAIVGSHPAVASIQRDVTLTSWTVSPAMIEAAVRWHDNGTIERRTIWQRNEIARRARIARSQHNAPHLWLPTLINPDRATAMLADHGVGAVSSAAFATSPRAPKGIRISLTAAPSHAQLHEAMTRVRGTAGIVHTKLRTP